MNKLRRCRSTWMYCDGKCYKCNGDVTVTDITYIIEPIFNATQHTECVGDALDEVENE